MFHRPKSESATQAQATTDKNTVTSQAGLSSSVQPGASASSAAPAASSTPNTSPNTFTEKDTNSMSANPESGDKTAETARTGVELPGSATSFQRPGVPPGAQSPAAARMPGQAPGQSAYAASPYGVPGAASAPNPYGASAASPVASTASTPYGSAATADGRRLVVGQGITLSGEIEHCDTLIVEGTIEAALKGASILDITETGMFYGTVEISECTIAGRFEGDLTVAGRLTVKSSGVIIGSISYRELAVEAGATVDGKISPMNGSGASSAKRTGNKDAKPKGRDQGNELPFSGQASVAG